MATAVRLAAEVESRPAALPISLVAAWTAPALPLAFVVALLSTYFLKFGTEVLGVAPGALGLVFGLSRVWEGVASPWAGFLSDRTRSVSAGADPGCSEARCQPPSRSSWRGRPPKGSRRVRCSAG